MLTAAVAECPEKMEEIWKRWNELKGYAFADSPIARLIDDATGLSEARLIEFAADCRDFIWERLKREVSS